MKTKTVCKTCGGEIAYVTATPHHDSWVECAKALAAPQRLYARPRWALAAVAQYHGEKDAAGRWGYGWWE